MPGIRDASEVLIRSISESEFATRLQSRGSHVVKHCERWWKETVRGFYEPVNPIARLTLSEATAPQLFCWAFRAPLIEADASAANATMPVHLLSDLQGYKVEQLSANRRYQLRRSQKLVHFVQILTPDLLEAEGYEVFCSAQLRTQNPNRALWTKDAFRSRCQRWLSDDGMIVIAGLVDGKLGGYLVGMAVDSTAFIEFVDISTEAFSTNISLGLHFEFIQACRRSPGIREIMHSQHIPEDTRLGTFKASIGFPVVHLPTRVRVLPPAGAWIRWRHPYRYYRLTGFSDSRIEGTLQNTALA